MWIYYQSSPLLVSFSACMFSWKLKLHFLLVSAIKHRIYPYVVVNVWMILSFLFAFVVLKWINSCSENQLPLLYPKRYQVKMSFLQVPYCTPHPIMLLSFYPLHFLLVGLPISIPWWTQTVAITIFHNLSPLPKETFYKTREYSEVGLVPENCWCPSEGRGGSELHNTDSLVITL